MTEKRFRIYKEDKFKEEWYGYPFHIKDGGEKVTETMPMNTAKEVANLLNSLAEENEELQKARMNDAKEFSALYKQNYGLKRENEQLKKLISDVEKSVGVRIDNLIDEGMIDDE